MLIKTKYRSRPIRFLEVYKLNDWHIKIYSISVKHERVDPKLIRHAKECLPDWLKEGSNYDLEVYRVATLIVHEGREGCFAIINWWIGENMLQHYVYFSNYDDPPDFKLYFGKAIIACVWEIAVMCFERSAWVEHVLKKNDKPDIERYLLSQLNEDV